MAQVTNRNGYTRDFGEAVDYMDDEILWQLHDEIAPCTEQEFFAAYETAHEEKYGEEWELSKANPCW